LVGLTETSRKFPRSARLSGRSNFLRLVRGQGSNRYVGRNLTFFIAETKIDTQFAISVSRRAGGAVRRNRLKRIIREFIRNNRNLWPTHSMILLSIRDKIKSESDLILEIGGFFRDLNE
jgi:ribonuclease P protein component